MQHFTQFKNLIDEYIALFDQLIAFESKKLDAIAANDVELLDLQMKDEQAYLLKLKGLDIKREKLQKQMNMESLSFREIISKLDGESKEVLQKSFEILTRKTEEMKAAAKSTKSYIELHLHSLNLLISKLGGDSEAKTGYNKNGVQPLSDMKRFESKKV